MAKATTAKAPKKVKKAAKAVALKAKPDGGKKGKKKSKADGFDALWRLADHPLVGELIAVGATAAVAAIASKGTGAKAKDKKGGSSRTAVKAAGTAAAAAIGQRLIDEFTDIKKASKG